MANYFQGVSVANERLPEQNRLHIGRTVSSPETFKAGSSDTDSADLGMEQLLAGMYTSKAEEEKLRRSSVANRRLLAIGDALRHIGNIYNTVNYAPSQTFNNPVGEEKQRYESGKALRDAANVRYMTYLQNRAALDAKNRQWEATFNYNALRDANKLQAQREYQTGMLNERKRATDMTNQLGRARLAETHANNEANRKIRERQVSGQLALGAQRNAISSQNAASARAYRQWKMNGGGGGGRGSNPYTYPTKNGYITMGRDLNTNQVGKKALFDEMRRAGVINDVWQQSYNNMSTPQEQSALLNTAVSQWLMRDEGAADYMRQHFGAEYVGSPATMSPVTGQTAGTVGEDDEDDNGGGLSIGWDDEDDEDDNDGLEIGW